MAGIFPPAKAALKLFHVLEVAQKKSGVAGASKLINQAGNEVKAQDVGSIKELKDRAVVGDALEHDHIPSFAALIKVKENEPGRPLTKAESKIPYQTVEVPKEVH